MEPRLMEVICHLSSNINELVTREDLVKWIWNEYGGGDEALSQAISFLRKLLNDERKEIIETIPKKGYILHGNISEPGKKPSYWIAGVVIIVAIAVFIYFYSSKKENGQKPASTEKQDKANPKPEPNP